MPKKFFFLMILVIGLFFSWAVIAADESKPIITNMQVPLPGFQQTQNISGSTLGQYISAVYKYGVALGASLAVIVMMIGGIIWLTSAGSADKIGQARAYIGGALSGLVLLLCSYLILYTINPDLVELKSLDITKVDEIKIAQCSENKQITESSRCSNTNNPSNSGCSFEKIKGELVCCCGKPVICNMVKQCEDYSQFYSDYPEDTIEMCINNSCGISLEGAARCAWDQGAGCFPYIPSESDKYNCGATYPQCNGICLAPAKCEKVGNSCQCQ